MSRNKLVAAYARLDTPDLPDRIAASITDWIANNDIDDLPYMLLKGRHTGKLSIANGGCFGDYDLNERVIQLCRLDRNGVLSPDMAKIANHVKQWREWLSTPQEEDNIMGIDDEHFDESAYKDDDDINEFRSRAYMAEIDAFMESDEMDWLQHDRNLTDIDIMCGLVPPRPEPIDDKDSLINITVSEDFTEHPAEDVVIWTNPDVDKEMEEYFKRMEEQPPFSEFVAALKNGEFGPLPEDFDGLALPGEPGYYSDEDLSI